MNKLLLAPLFLFLLGASINTVACDCPPIEEKSHCTLYDYDIVELVEVNAVVEENDSMSEMKVTRIEHFFGQKPLSVHSYNILNDQNYISSCNFPFEKGGVWLIFGVSVDDQLYVSYCSPTREVLDSLRSDKEILDFLRNYSHIPDTSVCSDLSKVDVLPDLNVLNREVDSLAAFCGLSKKVFIEVIIQTNGDVVFTKILEPKEERLSVDNRKEVQDVISRLSMLNGVSPAYKKGFRVNVKTVISLGK